MPKVTRAYLDARRTQILEAAIACFARQGFHRTTMHDIVKQSRLSPGAIYNYFTSKDEIIQAIAAARHTQERSVFAAAEGASTLGDAFRHIVAAFFGALEDPQEWRRRRVSMQLWVEAQRDAKIRKLVRQGIDEPRRRLRALVAQGQRRGEIVSEVDPDAAARLMIAAFHGFVLQKDWDERTPVEAYVEVVDFCLQCLRTDESARTRVPASHPDPVDRGATAHRRASPHSPEGTRR